MSIKKSMLAAAALAVLAFAALPAMASAQPSIHTDEPHFTTTGGTGTLIAGTSVVHCTSQSGTGEFEGSSPYTTGTVQFTFHGCKSSGVTCTTSGQTSGTIKTGVLPFHLDTSPGGKNVVLITPDAEGNFATFNCSIFVHVRVTGNGIIGELTSPQTNESSNTFSLNFAEDGTGKQEFMTTDTSETHYDLHSSRNGGAAQTAVEIASGTGHFTNGAEGTLT